jgi:hypothetical protein
MSEQNQKQPLNPARFVDALEPRLFLGWNRENNRHARDELVDWLRKKWKDHTRALKVADLMEACKPEAPCKSAACPMCSGAAQRLASRVTQNFLTAQHDQREIVCVTVVPKDGIGSPGWLSLAWHTYCERRWRDRLGQAGVGWFVGAVDFSFNEHKQNRHFGYWSEHLHGFTRTDDPDDLKKKLKEQFPKSDTIPIPVMITRWDGDIAAVQYAFKNDFRRRIGTDDGHRFDVKTGGDRVCRDTDKQPLKSSQKIELMLLLNEMGLGGRLFFRQMQFVNRRSGPTLVRRLPRPSRSRGLGPLQDPS